MLKILYIMALCSAVTCVTQAVESMTTFHNDTEPSIKKMIQDRKTAFEKSIEEGLAANKIDRVFTLKYDEMNNFKEDLENNKPLIEIRLNPKSDLIITKDHNNVTFVRGILNEKEVKKIEDLIIAEEYFAAESFIFDNLEQTTLPQLKKRKIADTEISDTENVARFDTLNNAFSEIREKYNALVAIFAHICCWQHKIWGIPLDDPQFNSCLGTAIRNLYKMEDDFLSILVGKTATEALEKHSEDISKCENILLNLGPKKNKYSNKEYLRISKKATEMFALTEKTIKDAKEHNNIRFRQTECFIKNVPSLQYIFDTLKTHGIEIKRDLPQLPCFTVTDPK